jgi:hypothetical protein
MKIEIDTDTPLSDEDKGVLRALLGEAAPAPAPAKKAAAAPAKKAAAKKAAAPEPPATVAAQDEPAEAEPEAEPEDDGFEALRSEAHALTSDLLAEKRRDVVVGALAEVGYPAASKIDDPEKLRVYVDLLKAADSGS